MTYVRNIEIFRLLKCDLTHIYKLLASSYNIQGASSKILTKFVVRSKHERKIMLMQKKERKC